MPKEASHDIKSGNTSSPQVALPDAHFVADVQMARTGHDLTLTAADGRHVVVENYFTQATPPDLVAPNGAKLTPQLVAAFTPPEHAGQYAANETHTMTDASPAGRITAVAGEAHIIHADGTRVAAIPGAALFQSDVIETGKTGAVNMLFADHTAFAVGEGARMSIDKYTYSDAHHSGASFFSVLQGVFVYTSGLIGKNDPGAVNVETPVGTIGIRGTAFVGLVDVHGKSEISLWDGAGYVDNAAGETNFAKRFTAYTFTDYQSAPALDAHFDPRQFIHDHKGLFSIVKEQWIGDLMQELKIDDGHGHHNGQEGLLFQQDFPWHFFHAPAWDQNTQEASGMGTAPPWTFDNGANGFTHDAATYDSASFFGGNHAGALTGGDTGGSGGGPLVLQDLFPIVYSDDYNATQTLTIENGMGLFQSSISTGVGEFAEHGTLVGTLNKDADVMNALIDAIPSLATYTGSFHFTATVTDAATNAIFGSFSAVTANDGKFSPGTFPVDIGPFYLDGAGKGIGGIYVDDRMAMSYADHPDGYNVTTTITLDDGTPISYGVEHIGLKNYDMYNQGPTIISGNWSPVDPDSNDYLVVADGVSSDIIVRTGGGNDIFIGGGEDDFVHLKTETPLFMDGQGGENTLFIGNGSTPFMLDFTVLEDATHNAHSPVISNFQTIFFEADSASIVLTAESIFNLSGGGAHAVEIFAGNNVANSSVQVDEQGFGGALGVVQTGTAGGDGDVSFIGTYQGAEVTLIIHQNNTGDANHINVSVST